MPDKRVYLSPPHMSGNEMKYIQEAFDTNWIAPMGPNVNAFEQEICHYLHVEHGLALSSGTAGIHLALKYLGVVPGDWVFCSSLTFAGSCNPVMYQYANPVFIDSEPESWNMSPKALEKAFEWACKENRLPKAVILVDLYGQSADYGQLLPVCRHYDVPVIEDAAEALGAAYKEKKCGTFGRFGILSFNGNKIITTSGGGMVVSHDEEAIQKMRFWSTQAREPAKHYEHKEFGYNYRMSNICAGIGLGQLTALESRIAGRKAVRKRYEKAFEGLPLQFMPLLPDGDPNCWLTVVTLDGDCPITPRDMMKALEDENIEARPVWKPMHQQPVFKDCPYFAHDADVSADLFQRGVCLPSGTLMTESEQGKVIEVIRNCFL